MIDGLYRSTYRWGYRCARLVWRFTRPSVRGALVAVFERERILLVRTSYRREWSFPGGGIDPGESPIEAAVREVCEEIGWRILAADLEPAGSIECFWHGRMDEVTFFRLRVETAQPIDIDRREVVEARFFEISDALPLPLVPHIRHLLEGRLEASGHAGPSPAGCGQSLRSR